jgi:hypothetical protein
VPDGADKSLFNPAPFIVMIAPLILASSHLLKSADMGY